MKRKGITPVIAIVLLLLITVGAVGVVYTQFQNLTGNPGEQLDQQQYVQNSKLTFASVYNNSEGDINISLRNTGSTTFNTSEDLQIYFIPEDSESGVGFATFESVSDFNTGTLECFQGTATILEPGGTYTCSTGVEYPRGSQSLGLEVSLSGADKSWTYTCSGGGPTC